MSYYDSVVGALAPPAVTVTRHVVCTTRSQFDSANSGLLAGDWVDCQGITFSGEVIFSKQLASYAKFTFNSACKFTGVTSQANLPAIWMPHPAYIQLIFNGCPITNLLGSCGIMMHGGSHIVIDGFLIHDIGGTALDCLPVAADGSDISYCFFRGELYNIGLHLAYDPHAEKGTGIQGCHAGDGHGAVFHHNTVALYGHDVGPYAGGAVIEIGDAALADASHDNVYYIKAVRWTMDAVLQAAGNAVEFWGPGSYANSDFKIIEATDMEGRAMDLHGLSSGVTLNNVRVEYGRANNCCQNPLLGSTESEQQPNQYWDPSHGIIYQDVQSNTVVPPGGGGGITPPTIGTFGVTTVGPSSTLLGQDYLVGCVFQAPDDVGVTSKVMAYLRGGASAQAVRAAIYLCSVAGTVTPGSDTPVAASAQVSIAAGQAAGWVDLTFASPPTFVAGHWYLLGLWGGAGDRNAVIFYDTSVADYWANITYAATGLPPNPYPPAPVLSGTISQLGLSVCAVYAPGVPVDTTPPQLVSAQVTGAAVMLKFDELLDAASSPAASAFAVQVDGSGDTASGVVVSGDRVTFALASAVVAGDLVTVAYTQPGTGNLRDVAANQLASFGAQVVANLTLGVSGRVGGALRAYVAGARISDPTNRIAGLGGGGL